MAQETEAAVENIVEVAEEQAEAAVDGAQDAMADAADSAQDVADAVTGAASAVAEGAKDAVADAGQEMADAMSGSASSGGGDCAFTVEVGDTLAYNVKEISFPKSCGTATITLTHTGSMMKNVMGHNWVLVEEADKQDIANAALGAGPGANYVPDDERVIAATELVGGGESSTIEVPLADLEGSYTFMCTFPGHWAVMQGTLKIEA
ncbi:MAG: azurin [Pseudomonadota bacterium]